MCGRLNVTDSPGLQTLLEILGIQGSYSEQLNIHPGAQMPIVTEQGSLRSLVDAYWSLWIEPKPTGEGYRPNTKFKTFNAQSRRLTESRLWKKPFSHYRCIVPASGFHEWKDGKCYNISYADGSAMPLAGLYRVNHFENQVIYSFTVITLPPQDAFTHIHAKSFPLALNPSEFDHWLSPSVIDPFELDTFLNVGIRAPIQVDEIQSPNAIDQVLSRGVINP